jgi:hypothetical protein
LALSWSFCRFSAVWLLKLVYQDDDLAGFEQHSRRRGGKSHSSSYPVTVN